MSKDKQIEEMAKATMKHCKIDNQCGTCYWSTCNECLSEVLYNAGYRNASEVAREIFEEIEEAISAMEYNAKSQTKNATIPIDSMTDVVNWVLHEVVPNRISELKKKYTEEYK